MKYNHAFEIAFEVESDNTYEDVDGAELRKALQKRLDSLSDDELYGVCNCYDTNQELNWR